MVNKDFEGHTPGPYAIEPCCGALHHQNYLLVSKDGPIGRIYQREDAVFLAAAPDLLAERDRLRAEVAELRKVNTELIDAASLAARRHSDICATVLWPRRDYSCDCAVCALSVAIARAEKEPENFPSADEHRKPR